MHASIVRFRRLAFALSALFTLSCGGSTEAPTGTPPASGGGGGGGGGSGSGGGSTTPRVETIQVTPATASIAVGQSMQLSAVVGTAGGAPAGVTWTTSNAAFVSVSASGNTVTITGVAAGSAAVTATSTFDTNMSAVVAVTITPPLPTIQNVTLVPEHVTLNVGQSISLTANVSGTGAYSSALTYTTSVSGVATATAGGASVLVAAVSPGTTLITAASVANPAKTATTDVTVVPVPVGCTTSHALSTVSVGQTVNGTVRITDCFMSDSTRANVYRIDVASVQDIDLQMTSGAFSCELRVWDANGVQIAGDPIPVGSSSRIVRTYGAGTYYIIAKPRTVGALGAYQLTAR
jgi:hypothetical protein